MEGIDKYKIESIKSDAKYKALKEVPYWNEEGWLFKEIHYAKALKIAPLCPVAKSDCNRCTLKKTEVCQNQLEIKIAEHLGVKVAPIAFKNGIAFIAFQKEYHRLFNKKMKSDPDGFKREIENIKRDCEKECDEYRNDVDARYEKIYNEMLEENIYDGMNYAEYNGINKRDCKACGCPNFKNGDCIKVNDVRECSIELECASAMISLYDFTKKKYTIDDVRDMAKRVASNMKTYYNNRYTGD